MKKNKVNKPLCIIGYVFITILSYVVSAMYTDGNTLSTFISAGQNMYKNPNHILRFEKYVNKNFAVLLLFLSIFYIIFILYQMLLPNKYMNGKEYGSAEFADIKKVNENLKAKKTEKEYLEEYVEKKHFYLKARMCYLDTRNRILSQNVKMDIEGEGNHYLNSNVLIVGGSGSGKTQWWIRPNIMQMGSSFVITDPKGEVLRTMGGFLEHHGYRIRVLNTINANGMLKSNHYNPFKYLKTEIDVVKMVDTFIKNTTPPDAQKTEPIWENGEKGLLQALCYYSWMETEEKNLSVVIELMKMAEVKERANGERIDSDLDIIFKELEIKNREENIRKGKIDKYKSNEMETIGELTHPAVIAYNSVMSGAADTVRSFVVSVNTRLNSIKPEILELLKKDEFNFEEIGAGVEYDGKTKTAVFCVIPDDDSTYNWIVGMMYNQMFQQLYNYADFKTEENKLPIPVSFFLDEFANVPLPENFLKLLATMRSRRISSVIVIQNFAQIKGMYDKERWETIPGNCDVMIYLGGNEKSTHKYMSESSGDGTYDKKTNSVTRSKQGSSSQNFDKYGRKLLMEDEIKRIKNNKCLVFVRGQAPIMDNKIDTKKHPFWRETKIYSKKFDARDERKMKMEIGTETHMKTISINSYEARKREEDMRNELLPENERTMHCIDISAEDLLSMDFENVSIEQMFSPEFISRNREKLENENKQEKEAQKNNEKIDTFLANNAIDMLKFKKEGYEDEKIFEFIRLYDNGFTYEQISELFNPKLKVEEIDMYINAILKIKE